MSKLDRDAQGRYKDPFAFLPRQTNISRQIAKADEREASAAPVVKAVVSRKEAEAFDKKAYMRDYMAKKRSAKKG